ncbi:MAG: hypothetical protein DCC49_01895 [Acidobacteria bacterium]|nr:MAG: hypothetical protein DCC49_01895 [Acidobacteriota bacterium]
MLEADRELIERFEETFDPAHPERGPVPAKVIGYGEMSTILAFDASGCEGIVFKRMALFETNDEAREYETIYRAYNVALADLGLRLPDWGLVTVDSKWGPVLYLTQTKLDPASVGHKLIHSAPADESLGLIDSVLGEIRKVYAHNASLSGSAGVELGLDSQISNWALAEPGSQPFYFDTSTPLMRVDGVEQLDAELFVRICPQSMQWVIRRYFLQDVLDRYYVLRLVLTDLLANLFKEQKGSLVPPALDLVNDFLGGQAAMAEFAKSGVDLRPIELSSVKSYYRQDMPIWWLFLNMRRAERFWRTKVRRADYRPILPGRTKRFHLRVDRG